MNAKIVVIAFFPKRGPAVGQIYVRPARSRISGYLWPRSLSKSGEEKKLVEDASRLAGVAGRARRGVAWNTVSVGLSKLISLGTMTVLARLLAPEYFGLLAYGTVAIGLVGMFQGAGVGSALIHRKDDISKAAETAVTLTLGVGIILFALSSLIIAPFAALYFRTAIAKPVVMAMSVTFLINALATVPMVLLQKELRFRRKLIPDVCAAVFTGAVSIPLAWFGLGVWSIVSGQIVGQTVGMAAAWLVAPTRPRFGFSYPIAKELLSYGKHVTLIAVIGFFVFNLDYLIAGRLLGPAALGLYVLAFNIASLPLNNVTVLVSQVAFPAYSKVQSEPGKLAEGFLATIGPVAFVTLPACFGLLIVAKPFVATLYGYKWMPMAATLQVLLIYGAAVSLGANVYEICRATGRLRWLTTLEAAKLTVLAPLLYLGALRFGIFGLAIAHAIVAVAALPVHLLIGCRILGIRPGLIYKAISGQAAGVIMMFSGVLLLTRFLPLPPAPTWLRLLVQVAVGVCLYLGSVWVIDKEFLRGMISVLLGRGGRQSLLASPVRLALAHGGPVREDRTAITNAAGVSTSRASGGPLIPGISVVIPNWNGRDLLETCLDSALVALERTGEEFEILVIDDGSSDGSVDFTMRNYGERVKVFPISRQGKFAVVSNFGFSKCRYPYVLLLNNDVKLEERFFDHILPHFEDPEVFAVTPTLFNWEGKGLNFGPAHCFFARGMFGVEPKAVPFTEPSATCFASGAASIFDRAKFVEIGRLDDLYGNYFEDLDISYRALRHGWKITHEPRAVAYHKGGVSMAQLDETSKKNRLSQELMFVWKNIDDPRLIAGHWSWYVLRVVHALATGNRKKLESLIEPLHGFGQVRRRRLARRQLAFNHISDRDVFELYSRGGSSLNSHNLDVRNSA